MNYCVKLFSENSKTIQIFLEKFYENKINLDKNLSFKKIFKSPIDMIELVSTIIDNNDKFKIGIWITIDKNIFINVTENNLDKIIKYFYERYPWF